MSKAPVVEKSNHWQLPLAIMLTILLIFVLVMASETAYQGQRPVLSTIDQGYLWTEPGAGTRHRGVDFVATTGTAVYAVADGQVVDLREDRDNEEETSLNGNYVVIQHGSKHFDYDSGASAYVYSTYLHLSEDTVKPSKGSNVKAGDLIAESDNTGNSTAPHLHLQLVIHPQGHRTLEPDTLNFNSRSRNPELWITPLSGRGVVIGKLTNMDGTEIGDYLICGLKKAGQSTPIPTYPVSSWANPDDLLYENFGTTDVSPGTYTLHANTRASGCAATPHSFELGTHKVDANRITYVGLYPSWLAVLRPSSSWNVQTYVANHGALSVSALNITYFDSSQVLRQWRSMASSHSSMLIDSEAAFSRSGLVVPSQDSSVFELVTYTGQPAGTTSITASTGRGSLGWERAGMTLYVPLVKDRWYDRQTEIYVTNVGTKTTQIQVDYYNTIGQIYSAGYRYVTPNLQLALNSETYLPNGAVYSAVITSFDQPIAAVALEQDSLWPNDAPALYNAYSDGSTTLYAPLVKKNYGNNTSGITLQNVTGSPVNFQARYYNMAGTVEVGMKSGTIPAFAPHVLYNPDSVPDGFVGSVRVTSSGKIVGEVSEEHKYGRDPRLIYNMPLQGSTNIYLPLWYDNYTAEGGDWASGVNVHNVAPINNNITITWYKLDGTVQYSEPITLSSRETRTVYNPPQLTNFRGSMWIRSTNGQPIVAASNIHNWAAPSNVDSALSFTGSNR